MTDDLKSSPSLRGKTVTIVTDSWMPLVNGVVTTLSKMKDMLKEEGAIVTVIEPSMCMFRAPCPTYPEIKIGIPSRSERNWFHEILSESMYVHVATEGPMGLFGRNFCVKTKRFFTTSYHTNFPEYLQKAFRLPTSWTIPYFRWFHEDSSMVLAPSNGTMAKLKDWGFKNVSVWSRGYDEVYFKPNNRNFYRPEYKHLLYVGRVSAEKNLEPLLTLSRDPKYRVEIVGEGPMLAKYTKKYPDVWWRGWVTKRDLDKVYSEADVFVFPSQSDTFGLVMIEAMACGTPVAAYPVEGPRDVVNIGGALRYDIEDAISIALDINRRDAIINAQQFTWKNSYAQFRKGLFSQWPQ